MEAINKNFQEKYPHITIERTSLPYVDAISTVKLVASDPDAPDVIQGDQGPDTDGQLVGANLLLPLDDYASQYGWNAPDLFKWTDDGVWGSGTLYGVSPTFLVNGVWYNKELLQSLGAEVPKTLAEFEDILAKAKAAGIVPIQFGNQTGVDGSFLYEMPQNQYSSAQELNEFIFGVNNRTLKTDGNIAAAAKLQEWVAKGYFNEGFNGVAREDARAAFVNGDGLFTIGANRNFGGSSFPDMGENVGFFAFPPLDSSKPLQATGGPTSPFHIGINSKHPDEAALYLDYIIKPETLQEALVDSGVDTDTPVVKDFFAAMESLEESNGFVGFLDVSAPGFGDALFAGVQELMANRVTPEEFVGSLDDLYQSYLAGR